MKKNVLFVVLALCSLLTQAQWVQETIPHSDSCFIYFLEVPNAQTVWASPMPLSYAGSNKYLRSADDGVTWNIDSISLVPGFVIYGLAPIDADTCYVTLGTNAYGKGYLVKTTNGGQSWTFVDSTQLYLEAADDVYFWNASEGITFGDPVGPGTPYFEFYKTYDAGNTWTRIDSSVMPAAASGEVGFYYSHQAIGDRIWFLAAFGPGYDTLEFVRSNDRGLHWQSYKLIDTTQHPPDVVTASQAYDWAFVDTLHGFFCIGNDSLFTTTDGGMTWHIIMPTGPFYPQDVVKVPGTTTLFSCADGRSGAGAGPSYSNDFGHTWTLVDSGVNALHDRMRFLNDSVGWGSELVFSQSSAGGIYKWRPATPNSVNNLSEPDITASVFPNPAAGSFYIKILKAGNDNIQMNIADENARLVASALYTAPGPFFMRSVDISKFAKGLYWVNITVGNNKYIQKLIIE